MDPTRPTGPPARELARAWLLSTAAVAALAALWLASTQVRAIRAHSPWADDPYDAVLSVASLVLPFVWAVTTARLLRWSPAPAAPPAAVRTLTRGIGVMLALVWAPVVATVASLAAYARGDAWGPWLGWLEALVAVTGALALVATVDLAMARRRLRAPGGALAPGWSGTPAEPDALDDISALLETAGRSVAPSSRRLGRLLSTAGATVAAVASAAWGPRRHRVAWCMGLALGFGAALAAWHGLAEGVPARWTGGLAVSAVFTVVGAAIVVVSYACLGTYLRLIRPERR